MKSVHSILEDLYALDPALREREQEIIPLIRALLAAKPEAEVNEDFAFRLRNKLISMPNPAQTTPFFRRITLVAALGVLGLAVAVPTAYHLVNQGQTDSADYAMTFTSLKDNAFGPLSASQVAGNGGGGALSASQEKLGADDAEGRSALSIAPGEPYPYVTTRYAYAFDGSISLPGGEGTVYRKSSGVALPEAFASANLGIIDLSRFGNLSTQYVTLRQSDSNGYSISIDTTHGTISINVNEGFWSSRATPGIVPEESKVIGTATKFLTDFGISTASYGTARIDTAAMMRILAASESENGYIEEYINVSWPLLIDGKEVLNSDGSAHGITVTVHAGKDQVSGANIITAKALEGSAYALEADSARIEEIIARGGMHNWQPETADKTVDVAVGEPTLVYTLHGTYNEATSRYTELYVPALKFNLTPAEGETLYQSAMVIPLVSSILDSNESQKPDMRIMDDEPVILEESVSSIQVE